MNFLATILIGIISLFSNPTAQAGGPVAGDQIGSNSTILKLDLWNLIGSYISPRSTYIPSSTQFCLGGICKTSWSTGGNIGGSNTQIQYNNNGSFAGTSTFTFNSSTGLVYLKQLGINSSSPIASLAVQGVGGTNPFSINSSTGASLLNVLQNGNVGIGTSSPARSLQISNATDAYIRTQSNSGGAASANSGWEMFDGNVLRWDWVNNSSNDFKLNRYNSSGVFLDQPITVAGATGITTILGELGRSAGFTTLFGSSNVGVISVDASGNAAIGGTGNSASMTNGVMTVKASGNVGIGTTTPNARLSVIGAGNTSSTLSLNTFSASGTSTFKIDDAGNAYFANDGLYYEASSSITYITDFNTGPINFDDDAGIVSWTDMDIVSAAIGTPESYTAYIGGIPMITVYGESNGSGAIKPTSTMVGIGTTTPTYFLDVWQASTTQNIFRLATSTNASVFVVQADGNVGIGSSTPSIKLSVAGTIQQNTVLSCTLGLTTDAIGSITGCVASDKSLKTNFVPLSSSQRIISGLKPLFYDWLPGTGRDNQTHAGFVAQDVEKVFPEAVVSAGTNLKGVDPNAILAVVVKRLQEMQKEVQLLKNENDILNRKLELLIPLLK